MTIPIISGKNLKSIYIAFWKFFISLINIINYIIIFNFITYAGGWKYKITFMSSTNSPNCITVRGADCNSCLIHCILKSRLPENLSLRALSILIIIPFILFLMPATRWISEPGCKPDCIRPDDYLVIRWIISLWSRIAMNSKDYFPPALYAAEVALHATSSRFFRASRLHGDVCH